MMQSQKSLLPCIEINPDHKPVGAVILLHGLGADGNDFVPIIQELRLPEAISLRFVFPNAPLRPVTINNGYVMPAWYDIISINIDQRADQNGLHESVEALNLIIENEIKRGIPSESIVLAGFSQGAVVALAAGLKSTKPLAGILALSGYLPYAADLAEAAQPVNREIPIFMGHGSQDPIVPYVVGEAAYTVLKEAGFNVSWHSYAMAHSVCDKEVLDIAGWLKKIFENQ